jgi:hypothetical protein
LLYVLHQHGSERWFAVVIVQVYGVYPKPSVVLDPLSQVTMFLPHHSAYGKKLARIALNKGSKEWKSKKEYEASLGDNPNATSFQDKV